MRQQGGLWKNIVSRCVRGTFSHSQQRRLRKVSTADVEVLSLTQENAQTGILLHRFGILESGMMGLV